LEVEKIFAHAQDAALAMHVPREGFRNRGLLQGALEDGAGSLAHSAELRLGGGIGHW
jgi:hypothetical protein